LIIDSKVMPYIYLVFPTQRIVLLDTNFLMPMNNNLIIWLGALKYS